MIRIAILLLAALAARAAGPVYVVLWFDTEDYVYPKADDAALRIATDLEKLGVRATFKVVGEKARTLEARGRKDVIRALSRHDIGYHSEYHSIQPAPAVYLRDLGWLEGAQEFATREIRGERDLRRIFGVTPSCYGQPGSSWGPQSYPALRGMGIRVYLDEGDQVGLDSQPFWITGILHVFNMRRFQTRASLRPQDPIEKAFADFDAAAHELESRGGGMISIYYHPTEFVTTEFWDAVNFPKGTSRERSEWKMPNARTPEDAERCFRVLTRYVEHIKAAGAKFVTARDLPQLYETGVAPGIERTRAAAHLAQRITFLAADDGTWSAAELLLAALGLAPREVDGPVARRETTYRAPEIARAPFDRAKAETAAFIQANGRLPAQVWIGSERLSIADFAATLAGDTGRGAVALRKGSLECEKYISTDPSKPFSWPIHPPGFSAPNLLELARLQAWTLKPARLR